MNRVLTLALPGTLGTNVGVGSHGAVLGYLTATDPSYGILASRAEACKAYADDGGAYTDETTEANEATGDDMTLLPATPAAEDAYYFGHASKTFDRVDVNLTQQGDGTWTITWEYWDGSAWTALSSVSDGTTGFTAATGWASVTFDLPTDWETNTVDSVLAYWVRARVSAYTAVTTQPLGGQAYIVVAASDPTYTDDTTDLTDAGAGDVALLPAYPVINDAFYVGHSEQFCKVKMTVSQARTGTATITPEYWNGTSWATLTSVDDGAGWSTGTSTYLVHFQPPTDWVANTIANGPNLSAGFFVRFRLSAITTVTAQPLGTQGWVLPVTTGASGVKVSAADPTTRYTYLSGSAITNAGAAADSKFILLNATTKQTALVTWTKGTAVVQQAIDFSVYPGDEILVVQVQEDGTAEIANASIYMTT
jgi:hypothetical protein